MTLHLVHPGDGERDHLANRVSAVDKLEAALASNRHCTRQLTIVLNVCALHRGSSGGSKGMAFVYADDPFADTFWYAHAMRHPNCDAVTGRSSSMEGP